MFQHVKPYAGDPILSLNDAFGKDPRKDKVNLSIGIYYDDSGKIPMLPSVRSAELKVLEETKARPYLPMEGSLPFRTAAQQLLFGANHTVLQEGRVATIQSVGSSGGIRVAADFIKQYFPSSLVLVSDPSWDNHRAVFEGAGLHVETYPYYDTQTGGVRFDAMLAALSSAKKHSVIVLHACCHNPTGVDLTRAQWQQIVPMLKERELIPFLDLAYQGFGDGLEEDSMVVRLLAESGMSFFVANSFSKNMGLYGERCGALSVVCPNAVQTANVFGQLQVNARRNYSNPPMHGAQLVTLVLTDPQLRSQWEVEVKEMRERIQLMRRQLHNVLTKKLPDRNFDYFLTQRGMFSYTGLTPAQCDRLKEQFGVYLLRSGRMCIAGLNSSNVAVVANAMAEVLV